MADRSSTYVSIGGAIGTPERLAELIETIESDGWGVDWSGPPDDWEAHIRERAEAGESLLLTAHESAGGGYNSEILDLAEDLGLHVEWAWDGCSGAYDGGIMRHHPGALVPPEDQTNADKPRRAWWSAAGSTDSHADPNVRLATLREWDRKGVLSDRLSLLDRAWSPVPAITVPTLVEA